MINFRPGISKLTLFCIALSVSQLLAQEIKPSGKIAVQESPTQQVIAEGIGATPEEAIKSAFRAAVRQVVGAVVDAEMIVKNDVIIEDNVLTYSDGFVKKYDEIPGSKSAKSGIHRITIKATIERRSIVAKLKASNVMMLSIDGTGLYSEAVSQLQAAADAATLIEKQFEGFPESCIKISIVGKPQTIEKADTDATIKFTVMVEPDLNAYKAFQSRLIPVLQKVALAKGEATVKFQPIHVKSFSKTMGSISPFPAFAPDSFSFEKINRTILWKKDLFTISVATSRTKSGDRADYRYFKVDPSVREVLLRVVAKRATAKLQLLDENAEVIATERFKPLEATPFNPAIEPLIQSNLLTMYGPYYVYNNKAEYRDFQVFRLDGTQVLDGSKDIGGLAIVGPTFDADIRIRGAYEIGSYQVTQKDSVVMEVPIKLSLEEIKLIKDAKVEIAFENGK